jgi:putative two-component system response regulator
MRVLVVAANPYDARLVEQALSVYRLARFEVAHVGTAAACLDRLKQASPDLLLLDETLPDGGGLSFLARIALLPDLPPVVILTNSLDDRTAIESVRTGAADCYPKDSVRSADFGRAVHLTIERHRLAREARRSSEEVILALADAVESKDSVKSGHLHRMQALARLTGERLGLDHHDLTILGYGAVLHDIGKVSISDAILCKTGGLTDAEWREMRRHPIAGEKICAPLRHAAEVGLVIRHHHERWDGTGYVDGLAGEEIPYLARIISVIDSFDAMTNDRPYKKAMTLDAAKKLLSVGAGRQWDPEIVPVFLEVIADIECGRLIENSELSALALGRIAA